MWKDRSTMAVGLAQPVIMDIEKANFTLTDASLDLSRPVPVNAAFTVKQGGHFTSKGNAHARAV